MKINNIFKSRWIVLGLLLFFVVNCAEEVPVACAPDADQCTTETDGGFQTGPAAGVAGGVVAVAGNPAAPLRAALGVPDLSLEEELGFRALQLRQFGLSSQFCIPHTHVQGGAAGVREGVWLA